MREKKREKKEMKANNEYKADMGMTPAARLQKIWYKYLYVCLYVCVYGGATIYARQCACGHM